MRLEQLAVSVGLPYELNNSLRFVFQESVFEIVNDYLFYSTSNLQGSQSKAELLFDSYHSNLMMIQFYDELSNLTGDSVRPEICIHLLDDSSPDLIELIQAYSRL